MSKGEHLIKHRMAHTPEHNAWCLMKSRCNNKNHPRYKDWGGRGITVHPEWNHDFMAFFRYIGPRPSKNHSVDRIDGSKGYEPGNVRWATKQQQSANRPNFCWFIENEGKRQTISEWAREIGISRGSLRDRLRLGWSVQEALNTPKGARRI
jgi:hypothetical protein